MLINFVNISITYFTFYTIGSRIQDPEKNYSGSRILGVKKGPDPGSAKLDPA
jgi:hypothetical protein